MGNQCATKPKAIIGSQINIEGAENPAEAQNLKNGKYCEQIGEYNRAIEFFTMAAQINPRSASAYNGVGNCHLKMGDFPRALYFYQRAISFDPNSKFAHNGMGVAYENISKDELAIKSFNKAIQIDPHFLYPYNGLGNLYYSRKKYAQALPYYECAQKLSPNSPLVLANLACCQAALGQHEQGLENFKKAQNAAALERNTLSPSNKYYLSQRFRQFMESNSKAQAKHQEEFKQLVNENKVLAS